MTDRDNPKFATSGDQPTERGTIERLREKVARLRQLPIAYVYVKVEDIEAVLALAEAVGEMRTRQAAGFDAEEGGDFGDFLADVYAAHRNLTGSDA